MPRGVPLFSPLDVVPSDVTVLARWSRRAGGVLVPLEVSVLARWSVSCAGGVLLDAV